MQLVELILLAILILSPLLKLLSSIVELLCTASGIEISIDFEKVFMVISGIIISIILIPLTLKAVAYETQKRKEKYINSEESIQNNLNELKIAQEKLQEAYDNTASFREGSVMYDKFQNELTYWTNKRRIAEKKG